MTFSIGLSIFSIERDFSTAPQYLKTQRQGLKVSSFPIVYSGIRFSKRGMESDSVRERSQALFLSIKPNCVELLEISNDATSSTTVSNDTIEYQLRTLSIALRQPLSEKNTDDYVISLKLADYIFVPISNLLKRLNLLIEATRCILSIVAFLLNHAWSHCVDPELLDQLGPLIVYLSGGDSVRSMNASAAEGKLPEFAQAACEAINAFLNCTPRDYYAGSEIIKRFSVLGDSTTILLELLQVLESGSEELIQSLLLTLTRIYATRVSSEQSSFVFPGIVSKVISFYITTKNLHSNTVVCIVNLLRELAVKVFSDKSLELEKIDSRFDSTDPETIRNLFDTGAEHTSNDLPVQFCIKNIENTHRTNSWLIATSQQFKLSLLTFVKAALLRPNFKTRLVSNRKLTDCFLDFITDILRKCFKSLFRELVFVTVDIASALYHASSDNGVQDDPELLSKIVKAYSYLGKSEVDLLLPSLLLKTESLLSSQLESALIFASEEKIALCLSAALVHLSICEGILKSLMKPAMAMCKLKETAIIVVSNSLKQSLVASLKKTPTSTTDKFIKTVTSKNDYNNDDNNNNMLDNIRLPPEIDASKIAVFRDRKKEIVSPQYISSLLRITLDVDSFDKGVSSLVELSKIYSKTTERQLRRFLSFLGQGPDSESEFFASLLLDDQRNEADSVEAQLVNSSVSLWIANCMYKNASRNDDDFNVHDFLDLNFDEKTKEQSGVNFLLLYAAKEALTASQNLLEDRGLSGDPELIKACETLQSVALEMIGILATRFSKEEFQSEVLMDCLHPLFEAFAQDPNSSPHLQAKLALKQIAVCHYDGSLLTLILDNSDYLIDSLSIKFSVSSGLTPALSGILLLVLRISGLQLLQSNQLQDIIAEMFIVIDSYHGYSVLVENFFTVFQEIIIKAKQLYKLELSESNKLADKEQISACKPWGMKSLSEMLSLIQDDRNPIDKPTDFDTNKEYFQRNPGVPFSEHVPDSDDEEEEVDNMEISNPADDPDRWDSFVSKNIYFLVEQIFKYGCQLLTHPSIKLKYRVLGTLQEAYPLLSTNYKLLMPLLAEYFPTLLVLCTGTSTLSDYWKEEDDPSNLMHLIVPASNLLEVIIVEDSKHDKFMSSRFIEIWNFLKKRSPIIAGIVEKDPLLCKRKPKGHELTPVMMSPKIKQLYSRILIIGLQTYERTVPDLLAHEIVCVCSILGIDNTIELGRDIRNHLWVIQNC